MEVDPCTKPVGRKLDRTKFEKSDSTIQYERRGRRRFKGSTSLRSTQVYPPNFGRAALWLMQVC